VIAKFFSSLRNGRAFVGSRASLAFLGAGAIWTALHVFGRLGSLDSRMLPVLSVAAFLATLLAIYWYRPAVRWPWIAIAAAMLLFAIGAVKRVDLATFGNLTDTRSLLPDLITLPGYVFLALGLTGLARLRRRGQEGSFDALLDCAIAALAALALAWVFLITPTLSHALTPVNVRLLLSCYPPLSVFLVAITAHIAFSPATRRVPAYRILLVALGAMLVGDIIFMLLEMQKITLRFELIELPYAIAYLAFGAAVLHPSMRELTVPVSAGQAAPTRGRLAFVAIALAVPAVVTLSSPNQSTADRIVLTVIVASLTGIAIWRVFRALREHARSEAILAHRATRDDLTDLPNRLAARECVSRALSNAAHRRELVVLIFLDVDRFKLVNDTVGHSIGDELLIAVAQRLQVTVRHHDLVARTGGDEFVIVLADVVDVDQAIESTERIRRCFEMPFMVRDAEIYSSASLGVAFADGSDPAVDFETMIRDADTAMYQAKDAGRDGIAVFDQSMRARAAERLELEHNLRGAQDRGELEVHFQPIVTLPEGHALGVEALVRWSHPLLGRIPPAKFIPIAEDMGLISELGGWVLDEACRQVSIWRNEVPDASELYVCVNLSARQLRDPRLIERVLGALSQSNLPPRALCLELTESILTQNIAEAGLLNELDKLGIRLSIDDFGTGFSSLSYLKRFPIDYVKIDRAFVEGLGGDSADESSDENLVAAIIAMAGALGMTTIAEGVETAAQERALVTLGCRAAQGFRYSRAVAPSQLPEALRRAIRPAAAALPALPAVPAA
jgi:diguanylate cyclase (GGDEF)-like protein